MTRMTLALLRRLTRFFIAGVLAILPIVVTVAVVVWVVEYLEYLCGPETFIGRQLTAIGMQVGKDASTPYFLGWSVVIVVVYGDCSGVAVDTGRSVGDRSVFHCPASVRESADWCAYSLGWV